MVWSRSQALALVQETDVLLASGGDALYLCHRCGNRGWQTCCCRLDLRAPG